MEPRVSRRGFTFECGEWTLFSEMREGLLFPMGAVYGRQSGRVACNRGRAGLGPARGKVAQFKKQRCKKLQCKRMLGEKARGKKMLGQENASARIYGARKCFGKNILVGACEPRGGWKSIVGDAGDVVDEVALVRWINFDGWVDGWIPIGHGS
jgi:hypothetical protein